MKRVLFLIPTLRSGGAERQAVTIAVLLKRHGYDVEFLVYFNGDFYEPMLKEAGIKIHRKVCNYLRRMAYVAYFIHKGHYDTIISFMPTPNFLNCFSAICLKQWRVIISERSSKESDLTSRAGRIKGWFYRMADTIVCNSNNSRLMWYKYHPEYKSKLTTIYNTVTLGEISTRYIPLRNSKLHIIVAATVSQIKNPIGLIEALKQFSEEERRLLHVDWYGKNEAAIGDHSEYDKVVGMISNYQLDEVITLHDATNDIANRMNEADCVALFSRLEGLPNVICEGMMIGKPIIMSRCSDYQILVEEGGNGYLCDWNNPTTIKNALLHMAKKNAEELEKMSLISKRKAKHLFSQDIVIDMWKRVIVGN